MAQEVMLGRGGLGKIRSFGIGALLSIVTLGFFVFWYWFVNDERKDVGAIRRAQTAVGVPEHERISPSARSCC
jgi:hypothetical protein